MSSSHFCKRSPESGAAGSHDTDSTTQFANQAEPEQTCLLFPMGKQSLVIRASYKRLQSLASVFIKTKVKVAIQSRLLLWLKKKGL